MPDESSAMLKLLSSPLPPKYVEYTKSLKFTEEPDYWYLQNLFNGVLQDEELVYDLNYEWLLSNKITLDKHGTLTEDEDVVKYNIILIQLLNPK